MSDDQIVAIFRRAGMLPGLVLVARLLDQHAARDVPEPEWRGLTEYALLEHLEAHLDDVVSNTTATVDEDSGAPAAAHVAARALQIATLAALEDASDDARFSWTPGGRAW